MDYIQLIVGIIIGAISVYSTAFLKEKAKLKASEKEKQKIILDCQKLLEKEKSEHQKQLEKEKKAHQLDIEKRKHQYESKRKQYYNFMEELDSFQACSLDIIHKELSTVMTLYYQSLEGLNQLSKDDLTIQYNDNASNIANKIRTQKARLHSQLNALKLSTDNKITKHLEELINEVNKSEQVFMACAEYIQSIDFPINHDLPQDILQLTNSNESKIHNIKENLISAMRTDLDNI
ncbi:hypothetical protein [Acinetobacter johnsonii]|jgi:hypothetical protein|uniref:hypothetical protein n=1 Tax=Acinetobacter johnsonii TaxID=40214 RepID=UPI000262488B|nr:hypothetical protein [Acinetobacter johnsonii]